MHKLYGYKEQGLLSQTFGYEEMIEKYLKVKFLIFVFVSKPYKWQKKKIKKM